jgi:hypothetical protein
VIYTNPVHGHDTQPRSGGKMGRGERNRPDNQTISVCEQRGEGVVTGRSLQLHDGKVRSPKQCERLGIGAGEGTRGDNDGLSS